MAVHRFWLIYSSILFCCCLLTTVDIDAQQANPFDIILTKSGGQSNNDQSNQKSQNVIYHDEELGSRDSLDNEALQDTIQKPIAVNPTIQVADDSNPFNVRKTNTTDIKTTDVTKEQKPATTTIPNKISKSIPSKARSSWFPDLKPRQGGASDIDYSLNFIFWVLIASLLILAVVINLKRKSFLNLYRAITNDNYLKLLQREEHSGASFFFLLLYFLFFLNAALFIYQLMIDKFEVKGYKVFLVLFVALFLVYLIRYIAVWLLQVTFPLEKEAKQYNFTIIMFNIIVGLLLIPINILFAYAPFGKSMIYVGLGVIALFYLLRQIRGLFIAARTKGLSYFHFFIYLCTFEVAPLIWILSFINF